MPRSRAAVQEATRHDVVAAGDVRAVLGKLARARVRWGLPAETRVVSAYEAGRDGFWLHRWLTAQAIANVVLDATSIERDRRAKPVKTDRLDAERLLAVLTALTARIAALDTTLRTALAQAATPATQQMATLTHCRGIGANGAARLVSEFFGWRTFHNGREIGSLAGLPPTPYRDCRAGAEAADRAVALSRDPRAARRRGPEGVSGRRAVERKTAESWCEASWSPWVTEW